MRKILPLLIGLILLGTLTIIRYYQRMQEKQFNGSLIEDIRGADPVVMKYE